MAEAIHKTLCDRILGAAFKVHNYLGSGLLESPYERLLHDLLFLHGPVYWGGYSLRTERRRRISFTFGQIA